MCKVILDLCVPRWVAPLILLEFSLPEYGRWLTTRKFLFLPVAAAADTAGYGTLIGAQGAMMGMEGGTTLSIPGP